MLKRAFYLAAAMLVSAPLHIVRHSWHFDALAASVFVLCCICLTVGLLRRP